jgi:oxygen-independent coproporphyrinogen-3 oxidase
MVANSLLAETTDLKALLERHEKPVPRYTSYPTAPHFHEDIGPDTYREWLSDIPSDVKLSLYAHIPFCDTLCWFCGCHTKITARYEPIAAYLEILLKEIALAGEVLGKGRPISHIQWGGGSPTILTPDDVRRLAGQFTSRFELTEDAEFALEIDPRGVEPELVKAIGEAGFNRASMGMQDANLKVQEAINRVQTMEENKRLADLLRANGIDRINLDLMYGLPYQTEDHIRTTVAEALTLDPSRIALFGYAHVPWMKTHMKMIKDDTLPGPVDRLRQSLIAADELVNAGFVRIGLDHFARPDDGLAIALKEGRLGRNFQGYTTDKSTALVGFGASAIGSLPQGYVQNTLPVHEYREAIEAGQFAVAKGVAVDKDDLLRREIINELMCHMKVDVDPILERFGLEKGYLNAELDTLKGFEDEGLITRQANAIDLTETGRIFMRPVCATFDAYLSKGKGRHSAPV